ncbi:MAG: RDD family protein [Armatimonadota bacterium]
MFLLTLALPSNTEADIYEEPAGLLRLGVAGILDRAFLLGLVLLVASILIAWLQRSVCTFLPSSLGELVSGFFRIDGPSIAASVGLLAIYISIYIIYTTLTVWLGGSTLGMWLVGCRVLRCDGRPVDIRSAFVRATAALAVGWLPIVGNYARICDYLSILANRRQRMIRDIAAGTITVRFHTR